MVKTKLTFLAGLALLCLVLISFSGCDPDATYTTIQIVRHAEVVYPPGENNPHLEPEGWVRAQALDDQLGDIEFDAIYVTEKFRTRETARPIRQHLGMDSTEINSDQNQQLVDHVLANHSGGAVLIVNHSHNIKEILAKFHAKEPFMGNYPSNDFDKLFTLIHTHKDGVRDTCALIETTYGAVSP